MNHLEYLTESVILDADYTFNSAVLEVSALDRLKEKSIHNTIVDTIKKWVVKIRNYIAKLIQSWIKKLRSMYEIHQEWIDEHINEFSELKKRDYRNITITAVPYWKAITKLMDKRNPIPTYSATIWRRLEDTNIKSEQDILETFTEFDSFDDIKRFYRGSDATDVVTIDTPSKLTPIVDMMLGYCGNYKELITIIQSQKVELDSHLKAVEKELNSIDDQGHFNTMQKLKLYVQTSLRILTIRISMMGQAFHAFTNYLKQILSAGKRNRYNEEKELKKSPIKGNIKRAYHIVKSEM
jgi:hypothetical protein